MRLCDYVVNHLFSIGVKSAYVVTGRGSLFLNDALAKKAEINKVFPHHEQTAAFAACAAASLTGEIQAVFSSTGCASTNVVTGVLSAWQDNVPMIVISGQNSLSETTAYTNKNIRTYGQQEANIVPIVSSITKYAFMITDPKEIRYHLEKACFKATNDNPGPVWIDIPLDLQNYQIEPDQLEAFTPPNSEKIIEVAKLQGLKSSFLNSKRPVFLIGSGAAASGAAKLLKELSTEYEVPIVYTHAAVDTVPLSFKNTIGSLGSQGASRAGAFTIQNSDLVIVLGSRMNSLTTGPDTCKFAREADVFAIDIDPRPHEANGIKYKDVIVADIYEFLKNVQDFLQSQPKTWNKWIHKCRGWKANYLRPVEFMSTPLEVDLYDFAYKLPDLMGDRGIFVCDSGFVDVILPTNAPFKEGQRCIRPISQGAMGFALPAVIGLGVSSIHPIYCVVGDGSIMFNIQELETISRYNINVKICVINNNMYAVIKRRQKKLFRERVIGVDDTSGLGAPNFEKISEAFSIDYIRCTAANYATLLAKNSNHSGPQIFEIPGKVEQDYLEIHHARTAQRRFVRRPLEDQKPFLSREEFLDNMIVEPIDQ